MSGHGKLQALLSQLDKQSEKDAKVQALRREVTALRADLAAALSQKEEAESKLAAETYPIATNPLAAKYATELMEANARADAAESRAEALGDGLKAIVAHASKVGDRGGHWWYLNYAQTLLLTPYTYSLAAHDARIRREEREAAAAKVDELAALVRQLVHSIRKQSPDNETARKAMDYLRRHELQGSPLRTTILSPAPDAAKPNNQQEQP